MTPDQTLNTNKLSLRELRKIPGATVCEGMVLETEKDLNPYKEGTEFTCVMCGWSFTFNTKKYMRILDALNIDYSRRIP